MSKRNRKRAARKTIPQGTVMASGDIAPVKPKAGPGQTFKDELIDMRQGYAKRFRNIGTTPLTLAYYKGHLVVPLDPQHPIERVTPDERYAAGLEIEKLWSTLHVSNLRDSTDPGISSYSGLLLTESKEQAGRRLRQIQERMHSDRDFVIAVKFCGEQWPAPHALHFVGVPFDRRSLWPRICETLNVLVYTLTGRTPPALESFEARVTTSSRNSLAPRTNAA